MKSALIICDTTAPGGVDTYTTGLARAARAAGWLIHAVIDQDEGADRLAAGMAEANIPCRRIPLHKKWPEQECTAAIDGLLEELGPDFVHVVLPVPWAGVTARECVMRRGIPFAATEQLVDASFTLEPELRARIEAVYGASRAHIAVSEANRRVLVESFGLPAERIVIVPNHVDVERIVPLPTGRREALRKRFGVTTQKVAITLARLDHQKGIDVLLTAAARIHDVDWLLWIAGVGPEAAALRTQAEESGVAKRVRWMGWRDDAVPLLAAADVFVLPSRYEGQPISLLEAMAAGIPVIATSVSGTPEALCDGELGTLVPPDNPAALAAALSRFLRGELPDQTHAARQHVLAHHNEKTNLAHTLALWDI
ncbi:MAG: glycosyltransferase [Candidatus Lernaella stagnicola]|nr:glycosyltransferase [Candidatus Lernaella stagnicola]